MSFELAWDNEDVFRRAPTALLARFLELPDVARLRELHVEDVFDQMTAAARLLIDSRHLSADAAVTVAAPRIPRAVRAALTERFRPPESRGRA